MKLIDGNILEIQLKNSLEKKFLGDIETHFVGFLRDQLKNDHTMVTTKFDVEKPVKGAYTNFEIFEEMAAKKPELLKLKEGLGLDTDF